MTRIQAPKTVRIYSHLISLKAHKPVQSLMRLARIHGPIFRLNIVDDLIIVSSQELVAEVCDDTRFDKKVFHALHQIRSFAGDGLFTAFTEEPNWEKAHRILMPAFGPASLRHMHGAMIEVVSQMLDKWESLGDHHRLDVTDHMTRLTLDTIALAAFDYRFHSFQSDAVHPFIKAMTNGLGEASARSRRPVLFTKLRFGAQKRFLSDAEIMHEIADALIEERTSRQFRDEEARRSESARKKDLLAVMLEAADPRTGEKLDVVNIRHQLVTFLIAGHETTSGLLSFALYEMLKHPDVLERARAEVDEVLGHEVPGIEKIQKLKYLDQILKETLRLWPTAPAFGRYSKRVTELGNQYTIKPDQVILVLLPALHRDPKVWNDPERFDPERMTKEAMQSLPPHAWKPFGTGARACIGRAFAMQEATLVLAMILQRFDLAMDDQTYQLDVKETLTLKPDGFYLRFVRRQQAGFAATKKQNPSQGKGLYN